jgi:hypothetical protein
MTPRPTCRPPDGQRPAVAGGVGSNGSGRGDPQGRSGGVTALAGRARVGADDTAWPSIPTLEELGDWERPCCWMAGGRPPHETAGSAGRRHGIRRSRLESVGAVRCVTRASALSDRPRIHRVHAVATDTGETALLRWGPSLTWHVGASWPAAFEPASVWVPGVPATYWGSSSLEGSVRRSLHRRGQLLVLRAALLGAVTGGAMGLVVEDAGTGTAGAGPGPRRGTALAARPPASQPAGSQAGRAGNQAGGSDASGSQPAKWAHRPDKRNDKADKRLKARRDKPNDRGNGNSGTTRNTGS